MQYPSTLQSGMKTRNPNKFFFFFYHDHEYDIDECYVMKKRDRKINC